MKCSKCGYLGFETGDRCKNCGFDFSLVSDARSDAELLGGGSTPDAPPNTPDLPGWLDELDHSLEASRPASAVRSIDVRGFLEQSLAEETPGFARPSAPEDHSPPESDDLTVLPMGLAEDATRQPNAGSDEDNDGAASDAVATLTKSLGANDLVGDVSMKTPESPIRVSRPVEQRAAAKPALPLFAAAGERPLTPLRAPRPPLGVRRTPEVSRVRALVRDFPATSAEDDPPMLRFADPAESERPAETDTVPSEVGLAYASASRRLGAAGIDIGLLGAISVAVVYLTLRMVELPFGSWRLLPVGPMVSFLGLVAIAYLSTFTAVGGRTVGKMATGVRVVTASGEPVCAAMAVRRTAASLLSVATLGLGWLPGLVGAAHLAVHDRLAGTRVVDDRRA